MVALAGSNDNANDAYNVMQLANLPIGRRLALGFALLLALMLFASAAAIFQLTQIEELQTNMVDRDWVQADAGNFINATTRENAVCTLELLIATEPAHRAQINASITRNKLAIDRAFATLNTSGHSTEGRVLLKKVTELRGRYVASFTRVSELVSQGRQAQATALIKTETLPAIVALQVPISAFADLQKTEFFSRGSQSRQHIQSSRHLLLALAGMGLLLGIVAARRITRSITLPIEQALQLAQQVASGDLSGRVSVQGDDEMARLLRALQAMNDSLVSLRMRAVLDTSLDAVIQIEDQGRITGWNAQAEYCFGWSQAQALGRNVHDLIIPHRYRQAHLRGMENHLRGGTSSILNTRVELEALHQPGHEFPIELAITPFKRHRAPDLVLLCATSRIAAAPMPSHALRPLHSNRWRAWW